MTLKTNTYQLKRAELKELIREQVSKMNDVQNSTQLEALTELVRKAFSQGMSKGLGGDTFDLGEFESKDYIAVAAPGNGNFTIYKRLR